jgi:hypothetical protein
VPAGSTIFPVQDDGTASRIPLPVRLKLGFKQVEAAPITAVIGIGGSRAGFGFAGDLGLFRGTAFAGTNAIVGYATPSLGIASIGTGVNGRSSTVSICTPRPG